MRMKAYKRLRQLIMSHFPGYSMRDPTTTEICSRLAFDCLNELVKLGFLESYSAVKKRAPNYPHHYYLRDAPERIRPAVLRQLHNLEKQGFLKETLDYGGVGKGRNYTWAYWKLMKVAGDEA